MIMAATPASAAEWAAQSIEQRAVDPARLNFRPATAASPLILAWPVGTRPEAGRQPLHAGARNPRLQTLALSQFQAADTEL